ncbi:hypothetical protein CDL15_Pgr013811 [Punica granatum]|uniref:Uncharacterized protein n=1 Tax=Punica granatum TaxID=22663 RepID=A0A218W180_PUNGR|nr:hypothetical protein CDL15_Pgr013811 [Punica granatum]
MQTWITLVLHNLQRERELLINNTTLRAHLHKKHTFHRQKSLQQKEEEEQSFSSLQKFDDTAAVQKAASWLSKNLMML